MPVRNAPPIPPGQATFQAQRTLADTALRTDGQQHALTDWVGNGQAVTALAGIAQPDRFFAMLRAAGLHVMETASLPDHADTAELLQQAKHLLRHNAPLLCTEKDAVKLWPQLPHVWAVPLVLQPEPAFFAALNDWWQQQHTPHNPHRPVE